MAAENVKTMSTKPKGFRQSSVLNSPRPLTPRGLNQAEVRPGLHEADLE